MNERPTGCCEVESTGDGSLRLTRAPAHRFFPGGPLVALREDDGLLLPPTRGADARRISTTAGWRWPTRGTIV